MTNLTQAGEANYFYAKMEVGNVYVVQETAPEMHFNTTTPTITIDGATRPNVLYGSGSWLGPSTGAFEGEGTDSGVGISEAQVWDNSTVVASGGPFRSGLCQGIQCSQTYSSPLTFDNGMEDGEHALRLTGIDGVGATGSVEATFKIDKTPPWNIGFSGMAESGAEISAAPHKLKLHSTDGTAPTKSSGVQSIVVNVDGGPKTVVSGAQCSPGECTASGSYELDAEALSEGVHRLTVTAIDYANNEAAKSFYFDVRHATPVPAGPGAVDPTTGQFTLTSNDVSLGGGGGMSRSYQSRNLTAGEVGPLGPQWAMSVGGGEGLASQPNGNVALISSSGGTTTFTLNSKGEFEAPLGDEGLKIEYKASEHKYVLKDATAGSETTFEQPAGTSETAPLWANQFGTEGVQLKTPESVAIDPSGNVWVTDVNNNRILKFSPSGTLQGAYGEYGSEAGQLLGPWGIAINQSTGNVYVTDQGNSRIDEFSPGGEFVKMYGWGVLDGRPEFETCTHECHAGIPGSGPGQFNVLAGITTDSSGDLWVADFGNNRVQEFNETGTLLNTFGSEGTAGGQFKGPTNIAISGAGVYVTDFHNARVQEFSTAGAFLKAIGWGVSNGEGKLEVCTSGCRAGVAGSGNGQFNLPRGIGVEPGSGNLYVSDEANNRVQELTAAGAFLTRFGAAGSGPAQFTQPGGVTVSASGGIYVVDRGDNRVEEWIRSSWWPTSAKGALPAHTTYTYAPVKSAEGLTSMDPSEVISPPPAGVSCGTNAGELKDGCRALTFQYATETTAEGEKWGEYKGHLNQVVFHAYNSTSKQMEEVPVAQYSYDKLGRLRAEWDPRIEKSTACGGSCPALKTTYGYDAEGHVAALTPPNQQPWAFTYGTIEGDPNTGRLLKVTRGYPKAKETEAEIKKKLEEEREAPKASEAPKLSGTPAVGVRMSVSNGAWSASPVVYGYQWEDCNASGGECVAIAEATNANYTPAASDVGHALVVKVTATNGGGSVVQASNVSAVVMSKAGAYTQSIDGGYGLNAVACVPATTTCVVPDSAGKALYATNVSTSAEATWKSWSGPPGVSPSEAADCPSTGLCVLADAGDVYYATSLGGSWTQAFAPTYGVDALTCASASFCADGQGASGGYVRYSTAPASSSWYAEQIAGTNNVTGISCPSSSFCAVVDSAGYARVAATAAQIESPSWTNTDIDGSSALTGIACTSSSACVAVDGAGKALALTVSGSGAVTSVAHEIDGTTSLTAVTCTGTATCVAVDSVGNVFVSKNNGTTWSKKYTFSYKLTGVSCASASLCATGDVTGAVTVFDAASAAGTQGEALPPQPGSTIEYRVPVTGGKAPYEMSSGEVEKWGQKAKNATEESRPVEATAIFPPDEPQTWPATDYRRATVDYMNAKDLTVNVASPTGGISTTEYNELNETTRTLSADNRALALSEGCESVKEHKCKSAEAAERLDTKTEYGAGGAQIAKILSPEHTVKLASGEEVKARAVTRNYYDEGAKEAEEKAHETYNLLTKSTSGALLANGEEKDVRTTTSAYSGQEGLGWKLRAPTSVTQDPSGLNLTATTVYNGETGQVVETKTPGGSTGGLKEYALPAGSQPFGIATGPDGNLWFTDEQSGKLGKIGPSGAISEYKAEPNHPEGVTTGADGTLWFVEHSTQHVSHMTTNGSLSAYTLTRASTANVGITAGPDGNLWFTESGSGYVGKINTKGEVQGEYALPAGSQPSGITKGPDGNLWLTEYGTSKIAKITTSGTITEYALPAGSEPYWITAGPDGNLWFTDYGTGKIGKINTKGEVQAEYALPAGSQPRGITAGPGSELWFTDYGTSKVGEITTAGAVSERGLPSGSEPLGIAMGPEGDVWVAEYGTSKIARLLPGSAAGASHDTRTVYYTAGTEAEVEQCRNHPEWAGLVCQTGPAAQPEDGLPALPVTSATYNIWDEGETSTESFASTKRTKTETYDAAGRALTSEETASPATDQALPKTTTEYNPETGAVEKQSATIKGTVKTIINKYDTLGQLISYTDAEGNAARYVYEEGSDARLVEESEGDGEEAQSKQTYSYDTTTGEMTTLVDSAAGTFTAGYDLEGRITSEVYPNGMCENTAYNQTGQAVSLQYIKTRNCTESNPTIWFSDSVVPSVHGEALIQTSTLSKESYTFDNAGRVLEARETPAGSGCRSRVYGYDEEGNRASEVTREASTETCPTEGGTLQTHGYDEANRLTDAGTAYEAFGDVTKLPAADAGGHELTSSYYVDGQVYTQAQNGETLTYTYDPVGRTMATLSEGKTAANVVSHYAGSAEAVTWTSAGSGKWSRNIPCFGGGLCATQNSGEAVVLQLSDLQGNIVATAAVSESETKLLSTYNSTEFGVPQPGTTPPRYAWLGSGGLITQTSMASGVATEGGAAYVPQLGRNLQTAPAVPPGAYPELAPGTQYTSTVSPGSLAFTQEEATKLWEAAEAERQRQREKEAEEACEANPASCVVDPYNHYNLPVQGIDELVEGLEAFLVQYHEAEISAGLMSVGGPVAAFAEGVFISYVTGGVTSWVNFFSNAITALKADAKKLQNRKSTDAEYLSVGEWYYELRNPKTHQIETQPYAFQFSWCWSKPRPYCSSNSRTYEI